MINLTKEDTHTIAEYIRSALDGYSGPVIIDLERLKQLHMGNSGLRVQVLIAKAKRESCGRK